MDTTIALYVAAAALIWITAHAAFVYAVRARWLARFRSGLFLSMVIALIGVALMAATVVGVWFYQATKVIVGQELVRELQAIGAIVESQVDSDLRNLRSQLASLGGSLATAVAKRAPASDLKERLQAAQSFDHRYLQLRLLDANGALLADSTATGETEPINRIAVGYNQEGRPYVSDAYFSPVYKREMLHVSLPITDSSERFLGIISARFDLRTQLGAVVSQTKFHKSGYAVIIDGEGQIIGHPDASRLETDVRNYPAVKRAWESGPGRVGQLTALNDAGVERLFVYRTMQNPATEPAKPWVLLTEIDHSEALEPLADLQKELALGVVLILSVSFVVARKVSLSIQQPLSELGEFAHKIGAGDFAERAAVTGRDVPGRLAATLNEMAAGLQERDHVKEVFGRYIATQVSDKILKGEVNLGGETRTVTILFSDIRNFTTMSEAMAPQQVVTFLNDYFSEMVDAVFEQGGVLDKFMGDGLLAVFGSVTDQPDHPQRAVRAALRMKALLAKINGTRAMSGNPPIAVGIGVHTAEVIVGNIGSRKRLEYTVVGDGVNTTSRLQTLNKEFGTTILISETTYDSVKDECECRQMPGAKLRGKIKELVFYEVVSLKVGAAA